MRLTKKIIKNIVSEFNNLVWGICSYGSTNATIINNKFYVGSENYDDLCAFGIEQKTSSGFAIENNYFDLYQRSINTDHYGIHTMNCKSKEEIYNNEFVNLKYANFSSNQNYQLNQNDGLQYICNKNRNNYADIYIQDNDVSKIQLMQGDNSVPAGNVFSRNANWHIYNGNLNGSGYVIYYYDQSVQDAQPTLINNSRTIFPIAVSTSNTCPLHYGGTVEKTVLNQQEKFATELEFAMAESNLENVQELYNNLKDGGSTDAKLSEVNSATELDAWSLRSNLLGSSPHLSEEVLKAMSDRTDILSESTIFEILSANPDEIRNEDLMKYLEEKENPLPEYMLQILKQLAGGTTYKTILESEMARYDNIRKRACDDMIRNYLNEEVIDYTMLRNWLDNLGGLQADYRIIDTYIQENNFSSALALANLLPSTYNFTDEEISSHTDYLFIINLKQTLYNEARNMSLLTASELATLNQISSTNEGRAGEMSSGILTMYGVEREDNCPDPLNMSVKNVEVDDLLLAKAKGYEVIVTPNPANQWTEFNYKLPSKESSAEIHIFNSNNSLIQTLKANGVEGQVLWNTASIPSGIYTYKFTSLDTELSGKIIIVH